MWFFSFDHEMMFCSMVFQPKFKIDIGHYGFRLKNSLCPLARTGRVFDRKAGGNRVLIITQGHAI